MVINLTKYLRWRASIKIRAEERELVKRRALEKWHTCFAWTPTMVGHKLVWLRPYERRWVEDIVWHKEPGPDGYYHSNFSRWERRIPRRSK